MAAPAEKIVGVIGGMGPAAAIEFCRILLELDPAECDQDHLCVILDNNSRIPNRTASLLEGAPSPEAELIRTARGLVAAGAGLLAMPCNTAHAWYDAIRDGVDVDVLSIIECTVAECRARVPDLAAVGLFASKGTIHAKLYPAAFGPDVRVLVPTDEMQERVSASIGSVKAGRVDEATEGLLAAATDLTDRGAQLIVAGCTEVPLALSDGDAAVPVVDSIRALARETVRRARGSDSGE